MWFHQSLSNDHEYQQRQTIHRIHTTINKMSLFMKNFTKLFDNYKIITTNNTTKRSPSYGLNSTTTVLLGE